MSRAIFYFRLLIPLSLLACGKSTPNDAFLISAVEQRLNLLNNPESYLREAAIKQLPDKERMSAIVNGCKILNCNYKRTEVIRRGKVIKSNEGVSQKFMVRIKGSATLHFLYTPSANWLENKMVQRDIDIANEEEFTAYTDAYGQWQVRR